MRTTRISRCSSRIGARGTPIHPINSNGKNAPASHRPRPVAQKRSRATDSPIRSYAVVRGGTGAGHRCGRASRAVLGGLHLAEWSVVYATPQKPSPEQMATVAATRCHSDGRVASGGPRQHNSRWATTLRAPYGVAPVSTADTTIDSPSPTRLVRPGMSQCRAQHGILLALPKRPSSCARHPRLRHGSTPRLR